MRNKKISAAWWKHDANKPMVILMGILHAGALAALLPPFLSWSGLAVCVITYLVSGWLGITLCYHRLLTHGSFKTYRPMRAFLTICGTLAWQGPPIVWVGTHRYHHAHSDHDEDPHSPKHGFTWAHILWVLTKNPEFNAARYARDLEREALMRWLNRYWWLPQVVLAILLFALGLAAGGLTLAFSWVFWGIGMRTVLVFHSTWFVNSAAHTWGYQNYKDSKDGSRNNWWVALLSLGEGWHNNHHGEQRSAAHGMRWFEVDPTYWTIIAMSWVGLAWDVVRPQRKFI